MTGDNNKSGGQFGGQCLCWVITRVLVIATSDDVLTSTDNIILPEESLVVN